MFKESAFTPSMDIEYVDVLLDKISKGDVLSNHDRQYLENYSNNDAIVKNLIKELRLLSEELKSINEQMEEELDKDIKKILMNTKWLPLHNKISKIENL